MADPRVRRAHPSIHPERRASFLSRIYKTKTCWFWMGKQDRKGYGRVYFNTYKGAAHRLSYEIHVGPIPEGLEIDHLCRNRLCVNPEHLDIVTHAENLRRAALARTGCPQGHAWTETNTYISKTNGSRQCRMCARLRQRELSRRRKAWL